MKQVNLYNLVALMGLIVSVSSCKEDDEMITESESSMFKVSIQNVFEAKDYFSTGTTGLIEPGKSESFSFDAGMGQYLSFATMFVQSNDLFYAPEDMGIALYDEDGSAVTGDVTVFVSLWDAGTEMNEEPGLGANQPPRQSGANTGTMESNPVTMVNDAYTYPTVNSVIKVEIENNGSTMFTVTISNESNNSTLPTPFAPGVWVVNTTDQMPIFTEGMTATDALEHLAEDGDNSMLNTGLTAMTGFYSPFAPGAYNVGNENMIFMIGNSAEAALEHLAEDGDPSGYTHIFNTPEGVSEAGPLLPDGAYTFTFSAKEGDKLSFAAMLVQSNDWFVGVDDIDLFSNGAALSGDITSMVKLFDAGTEVDEYAGAGKSQPLRQSGANTGDAENGTVGIESSASSNVPMISDMVKVTITPI